MKTKGMLGNLWSFVKVLLERLFHIGAIYWVLGILIITGVLSLIIMRRRHAKIVKPCESLFLDTSALSGYLVLLLMTQNFSDLTFFFSPTKIPLDGIV